MRFPAEVVARLRPKLQGLSVCVTGGAGFIGGHLVDALLSLGASITVIDDLSHSSLSHLAELIELEPERVRFVHGSILDDEALTDAVADARFVFHLAAVNSVPRSLADPQRSWSVNSTGTLRVLEAARRARSLRVVYAASSSAYGDQPTLPAREDMLPAPLSPYAASKLAGEHLMAVWARSYSVSTASLRFFNIFGPRQPGDSPYSGVVAAFLARLLAAESPVIFGDGQQARDFTFVSNAVYALLLAATTDKHLAGEVMNIGTGRQTRVSELATLLAARVGAATPIQPVHQPARGGEVRHSLADTSRARELIGYTPLASLEQGLDLTVDWARRALSSTQ